jgi:hypothetical protein
LPLYKPGYHLFVVSNSKAGNPFPTVYLFTNHRLQQRYCYRNYLNR